MVDIVDKNNPTLRAVAKEVPLEDISSAKIQKVITNMKIALASQDDGVAIAAPQIGVSLRIFVVSGKVIGYMKGEDNEKNIYPDIVYINPVITKRSKEKKNMEEGCLSVRYLYGKVSRSAKVQIEGYDENGNFFNRGGAGLMAQIFQHETDHLDGILFIDSATGLKDMPPEKITKKTQSKK
jgi:peptide deformylase